MPDPAVEPKVQDTPPAEPSKADAPPAAPPTEPSPLEKQIADLQSKLEGLTSWENSRNQETVALKRELETLRLERQNQPQIPAQPDRLTQLAEQYNKAVAEQDTIAALQAKSEYDREQSARLLAWQITNNVNAYADAIKENPKVSPEVHKEFLNQIYVDGDPRKSLRPDKLQVLSQPGALGAELELARKAAMGAKVLSGDYDKEVITRYEAEKEAKKKMLENQTPLAGNPGGGQPPAAPSPTAEAILIEELSKQAQVLRGEIPPPQG